MAQVPDPSARIENCIPKKYVPKTMAFLRLKKKMEKFGVEILADGNQFKSHIARAL